MLSHVLSENKKQVITSVLLKEEGESCGCTGVSEVDCALTIVLVKGKSIRSNQSVETNSFLDPGCSDSFCAHA